jgi:phage shock protein A
MGIFQRISDIISANLNDMVENYEDPEKMLKQAVREMEEAIATSKRDVAKTMANEKLVKKELASNEAQVEVWSKRAEAAVDSGDDALARKAITRKREYEKVAEALRDQASAAEEASQSMRKQLDAMQAKLSEARRRLGTLTARQKAAQVRAKMAAMNAGVCDPDLNKDAFDKFDRLSRKVEMAEAEAEALNELTRGSAEETADESADADFGPSGEDLEIESELALLKKQKQKGK